MRNLINKMFVAVAGIWIITGISGCASSSQKDSVGDEMYTPISLYLDPLKYTDDFAYSEYFPLFANYPTDWAKCGLRNYPMEVSYDYFDVSWNARFSQKGWFNLRGQLVRTRNTAWGVGNDNTYDEDGKLVEIMRYYPSRGHLYRVPAPEYQDSLISAWWRQENIGYKEHNYIFTGIHGYKFIYYPDGVLKTLEPKMDSSLAKSFELGKMEFNEKGQLQMIESPFTSNPFLSDIRPDAFSIHSVSTFIYDERGLCSEKIEKYYLEGRRGGKSYCDTTVSVSSYIYNERGDLVQWTYDGGIKSEKFANNFSIDNVRFDLKYRYKYDEKGNWTEMLVELPLNFQSNYVLARYYQTSKNKSPYQWDAEDYDTARMIVIHRSIDGYYETDYAGFQRQIEAEKQRDIEEEKNHIPKYTGVQAYGLQGPVKMVKNETEKQTVVFNKIGNVESFISSNGYRDCNNTFIYQTPFRYTCGDIKYRIECEGNNLRIINESDEEIFGYEDEYEFDDQGRVRQHSYYDGMMGVIREYAYKGDSKLPYQETESSQDETGDWSTTFEYEYIDIDKHGNWTKRKGISRSVVNDYEEVLNEDGYYESKTDTSEFTDNVEEVRKITYY